MAEQFNERTWLIWLGKVRIIVITFLFGIELAVAVLTPTNIPKRLFVLSILLWYAISVFYMLVLWGWRESRFQSRLQVLTDLAMAAAVVYITGGIDSPFNFLYPLLIIVAAILLPRAWAFLTAALAFIICGALLELSYFDVIRSYSLGRPDLKSLQASILINLFAYMAVAYLSSELSQRLRQQSGALEDLQALHENIVNSMSGGLITTGMDGRVTLINAAGQRLLERGDQEVVGRPVERLFVDRLAHPGLGALRCEVRSQTQSGYKSFGMTRSALEVPERGHVGYVYTFDDLTEIRRLEREVQLRDRMAALGRMAAGIAHEIRNPLASIVGSVKVLSDVSVLSDEQHTLVDIVTRESERLNSIISDFLTYSRDKQYHFNTMDLLPLLEDTLTLLENRARIAPGDNGGKGDTRWRIVRDFAVRQAPALVDGDRMKQVFWNICENAARAMPDGGTLSVSLRSEDNQWLIGFADTGCGLSGPEIEKIFEPFQSGFPGGTGFGLAIVYQIVQAHEGKIGVRSTPGQGTEFTLQLRHSAAQTAPAMRAAAVGKGARG